MLHIAIKTGNKTHKTKQIKMKQREIVGESKFKKKKVLVKRGKRTFLPFFQLERLKRGEDRVGFGLKDLLNGIFEPISLLSPVQIHIKQRFVERRFIP